MYQIIIENGYIVSLVSGVSNGNISEEEHQHILDVIRNKPKTEKGFDYKLRENLTWELHELSIVEEEAQQGYTEEQLTAMTADELKAICAEMGISGSMTKTNMIALIMQRQGNNHV